MVHDFGERDEPTTELPFDYGTGNERFVGSAGVPQPIADHETPTAILFDDTRVRLAGRVLRVGAAIAIAVVLVSLGVVIGFSVHSGSPAASGPIPSSPTPLVPRESPRSVTQRYLAAVNGGNVLAGDELVCRQLKTANGSRDERGQANSLPISGLLGARVGEEQIAGDTASVDVQLTVPIVGALGFAVQLVVEDGVWRVCGTGIPSLT